MLTHNHLEVNKVEKPIFYVYPQDFSKENTGNPLNGGETCIS